ncbi:MAG: integrase arm-type DNA-binding domain-containing protein [Zoogloeaceae bacterium]|jgi:integrase|nr:integrase arm-type DNA-binding domain-containing protein [Zoogloeaceae bacterium]
MPKIVHGLTVKQIEAAKPRRTLLEGKGLMLIVDANGNRRWVLRYTRPDGRRNMIGLGSYPEISLAAARTEAHRIREGIAQGVDPVDTRQTERQALKAAVRGSFKAVGEAWYAHKSQGWAKETARKAREVLDDYLYPRLAVKQIADITTADIKPVLLYIHGRGPRLAVKARQYCNQIIEYAIQEGLREDGRLLSLRGALPKADKSHYAAVTRSGDLPALLDAINGIESRQAQAALLTCLYTASRPGVVVGMRWDELDMQAREWHIPAERMKTGNDHISPLPGQLIPLLEAQRLSACGSPFVFPGVRDPMGQHMHRDSLSKVLRENGLQGVTVTHGFRATFRTIARERLRVPPDVLEAQLAHAKKDEIQAAYDRAQFLEDRHALVQQWADYLDKLKAGGEVIPLRGVA